jgi:hypothetical protein
MDELVEAGTDLVDPVDQATLLLPYDVTKLWQVRRV